MKNKITKILLVVLIISALLLVLNACGKDKECSHSNQKTLEAVAPTCLTPGITEGKQCSDCGAIIVEQTKIDALGHTEETVAAVAPTCTEDGLTEGKKCSVCGDVTVAQEVVKATGHTEEVIPAVAPTCTATGLTEGKKCSVCGDTLVAQETVEMAAHTEEIIPAVAPTCTATGLTEGKKCSVCGDILVAQETVEKAAHTEEIIPAVAPTCTETGLTEGKKCSVCGDILVAQETVDALDHDIIENAAQAPTCTETGWDAYQTCSKCDYSTQVIKDALGHTDEEIPAVAPTCTETGLTAGTKCTVCGEITKAQEVVDALGHTDEEIPAVAPTCTETGLTAGTKCTVCGVITKAQETVDALGHTEEEIPAVAPTCTETGLTAGVKCSVCDEILTAQDPIDALGHDMQLDESYLDESGNPTCLSNGDYIYTCTHGCGKQDINLNGEINNGSRHAGYTKGDYETAPTCITPATYYCTDCKNTFPAYEDDLDAQPTGIHTYDDEPTEVFAATCAQYGYETYACTCDAECTYVKTVITDDKLEHTLVLADQESDTLECAECGVQFRNVTADVEQEEKRLCATEPCDGTNCLVHNMVVITTATKTPEPDTELPGGEATDTAPAKETSIISLVGAEDTTYEIKLYDEDGVQITTFNVTINNGEKDFDVASTATGTAYVDISEVADQVATIEITASAAATVSFYNIVK